MNALSPVPETATDITPSGEDYAIVKQVIELITIDYREQPSLDAIAAELGQSPTQLQKVFTRWAGLSPKAFLQAVTLDHAKRLLHQEEAEKARADDGHRLARLDCAPSEDVHHAPEGLAG